VILTDIAGKEVLRRKLKVERLMLNTAGMEKGMYFLQIRNSQVGGNYHPIIKVE